jgi:UDP-N-acetylmuramate--alanine ligase
LSLTPTIAVINNVEADHLECYGGSVAELEAAFVQFARGAQQAIVGGGDAGAARVAAALDVPVWRFGTGVDCEVRITDVVQGPDGSQAQVALPGAATVSLRLRVPGMHNLRNAVAALAVVRAMDADLGRATAALAEFGGVARRFERVGEIGGVTVIDDYAHHPSEVRATLLAARQAFPARRLVAVFQPHLYSRTALHGDALGRELAAADRVVVAPIYAAREQPLPGVTAALVVRGARTAGKEALTIEREALAQRVADEVRAGDVVLTLGAGDVTQVGRELLGLLERRETAKEQSR